MVKQVINVGANANDGTGDDLRTAMQKINTNFSELYGATAEANDLVEDITPQLGGNLDLQNFIITTALTNGNISLQPNGTGSVLLKNIRITDNVISSDDSTSITINESLAVTGSANFSSTLSAPTVVTNVIRSDDSSIIEINNGLQVAGSVKSTGVVTNSLSSEDSTAIQVGDSLNVNGTVTASTVNSDTVNTTELNINNNQILAYNSNSDIKLTTSGTGAIDVDGARIKNLATPSAVDDAATKAYVDSVASAVAGVKFTGDDSTGVTTGSGDELQIKGAAGITTAVSGVSPFVLTITGPDLSSYLTSVPKTIDVNEISSGDSSAIQINDAVNVSGTFNAKTIVTNDLVSQDSSAINVLDGLNVSGTLSADVLDVNEISSGDSTAIQINNSINISGDATVSGTINGSLAFSNLTGKPTTVSGYGITDAVSTSTTAIAMVGDDSTGTAVTIGETFKITGTSNITTAVSGDTLTITGPNLDNIITVVGDDSTGTAFNAGETLKIAGGVGISTAVSGDTITISATGGGGGSIGDLVIEGQTITTGPTNADLTISPNGVGNINLDADIIRVGDVNTAVTITSNGTGNLTLQTNSENPTIQNGYITLEEGTSGKILISPSQDGYLKIGNTTWTSVRNAGYQTRFEYGLSSLSNYPYNMSTFGIDRLYGNSTSTSVELYGVDPNDGTFLNWRGHETELWTEVFGRSLVSETTLPFDTSSRNSGTPRSYSGGPIAMGIQNNFTNENFSFQGNISETAILSMHTSCHHTASHTTLNFDAMNGAQVSFNLAFAGGSTTVDDITSFLATGNYISNGTTQVDNYYAFRANNISEADNNYGIYIDSPDWTNYLGGLTIKDSSISADNSNENLTLSTSGTGKVVIDDTLSVGTVELNEISSADSSAIQINDSVNVSGTLTTNTSLVTPSVVTNAISSSDSSSVTINDDLEVKSQLFVNTISSNDSSAITVNDDLEVKSSLYINNISSNDSSAITVNDDVNIGGSLTISGTLNASTIVENILFTNEIASADSSAIQINDSVNISGVLSVDTIDINTISSGDSSTIQINDSVQISDNLTMGGLFTLYNRTVAQLSALTPEAGTMAYCTDETGGAQPVFYDGTNWRRMTDRIVIS